jgi:predicted nucleic acid-binding protein
MSGKVFVDTSILVYAHDLDAKGKHETAKELIASLWHKRTGVLSVQVLQEFYVVVTRKIGSPVKPLDARSLVKPYLQWVVPTDAGSVLVASEIEERNHISFWDAMIVAAAQRAGAERIATEDLNPGQYIDGILIENPFT